MKILLMKNEIKLGDIVSGYLLEFYEKGFIL